MSSGTLLACERFSSKVTIPATLLRENSNFKVSLPHSPHRLAAPLSGKTLLTLKRLLLILHAASQLLCPKFAHANHPAYYTG